MDLVLASTLIDLLDREVPTIAEVLCRSHLWRTREDGLHEEEGKARASLLSHDDIGCRIGDDLARVVREMIRLQFSIQPIFDSRGSQIGSLELKRITGLIGRGGWGALPPEVSEDALSEIGLLGPMIPMVDPMERSDTVSQVLSSSIDAVIFRWDEARYSKREGFQRNAGGSSRTDSTSSPPTTSWHTRWKREIRANRRQCPYLDWNNSVFPPFEIPL